LIKAAAVAATAMTLAFRLDLRDSEDLKYKNPKPPKTLNVDTAKKLKYILVLYRKINPSFSYVFIIFIPILMQQDHLAIMRELKGYFYK
jgi:hypothetical protein